MVVSFGRLGLGIVVFWKFELGVHESETIRYFCNYCLALGYC